MRSGRYRSGAGPAKIPLRRRNWYISANGVPGLICSGESPYIVENRSLQKTMRRSASKTANPWDRLFMAVSNRKLALANSSAYWASLF